MTAWGAGLGAAPGEAGGLARPACLPARSPFRARFFFMVLDFMKTCAPSILLPGRG